MAETKARMPRLYQKCIFHTVNNEISCGVVSLTEPKKVTEGKKKEKEKKWQTLVVGF